MTDLSISKYLWKKKLKFTIGIKNLFDVTSIAGSASGDGAHSIGSGNSNISMYTLRFTCTSKNPYLVQIDGNSNVVQGNTYREYYLKKGTYAWKVTQQSGYVFYPTIKEGTITLDQDKEIVFP